MRYFVNKVLWYGVVVTSFLFTTITSGEAFAGSMVVVGKQPSVTTQAPASAEDAGIQLVEVSGMSDPDERSYRKIIKAMDVFEKFHYMAPNATLCFELQPAHADVAMKNVKLNIKGDKRSRPVVLAPDMSFTVPRDQDMLDADALVISNRHDKSLLWRSRIRTPGLPPNVRRLGDLRLEWHVDFVASLGTHWITPVGQLAMATMDKPYELAGLSPSFLADRPLFGVTMLAGQRKQVLGVDMLYFSRLNQALPSPVLALWKNQHFLLDRAYELPLSDTSWPDDTLVIIEYMDDDNSGTSATINAAVTLQ